MKLKDFIKQYSDHQPHLITCLYWNAEDLEEELDKEETVVFDFGANLGQEIEFFKNEVLESKSHKTPLFEIEDQDRYRNSYQGCQGK